MTRQDAEHEVSKELDAGERLLWSGIGDAKNVYERIRTAQGAA